MKRKTITEILEISLQETEDINNRIQMIVRALTSCNKIYLAHREYYQNYEEGMKEISHIYHLINEGFMASNLGCMIKLSLQNDLELLSACKEIYLSYMERKFLEQSEEQQWQIYSLIKEYSCRNFDESQIAIFTAFHPRLYFSSAFTKETEAEAKEMCRAYLTEILMSEACPIGVVWHKKNQSEMISFFAKMDDAWMSLNAKQVHQVDDFHEVLEKENIPLFSIAGLDEEAQMDISVTKTEEKQEDFNFDERIYFPGDTVYAN